MHIFWPHTCILFHAHVQSLINIFILHAHVLTLLAHALTLHEHISLHAQLGCAFFWPHTFIPLYAHDLSLHAYIITSCKGKTIFCSKPCSSYSQLHALGSMWRRLLDSFLLMVMFGTMFYWHWVSMCTFYPLEMFLYSSLML